VPELTAEQYEAVERRDGSLLVRAGAGAGKTSVLVERFVRAVIDDDVAVDEILAITFTEKAAAEMRTRVRRRFRELGHREAARAAEQAWISTIHGFCSRVLRAHALSAGIDPEYHVLEALDAERAGLDAFDRALEDFLADGTDAQRIEMVAAYTPDKLREMVRTAYSHLRSRGQRHPVLEATVAPAPAGEQVRLAAASAAALAELGQIAEPGKQAQAALIALERCSTLLARHASPASVDAPPPPIAAAPSPIAASASPIAAAPSPTGASASPTAAAGSLPDPAELDRLALKGSAKALATLACEEYRQALAAYRDLAAAHRQHLDHTLLRELLDRYGMRYDALKRDRSGVDFEDLELITRDLLVGDPAIRTRYAERFAHVLVDEFQDTNPLQNELLELLARDNFFRVGDEHQSIYGFRNADVEVFRDHHSAATSSGRARSITMNFRSRGEVLDAIDRAFAELWGDRFEPLRERPDARAEPPRVDPPVELLVVDKKKERWDERLADEGEDPFGRGMRAATPWRAAEARLLARRIDELTRSGPYRFGDVVVLMRATTHMAFFERALEERGIPTYVVGGRGYWSQQQVADLRHWLATLANPLDELSLYSVLASPLVGVSLDALALIGLQARRTRRDAWWLLREPDGLLDELPPADRPLIEGFVKLLEEHRRAAPTVSLETLIDRAVTDTGYDRHVLSLPAGDRRMANIRKLMRVARAFEAEEGRDLRAFIDVVAERDMIAEREGEAPLEAEELDAVRLMTVHRAKGLEFPVVCVADLGKDGREEAGSLRISDDGQVGLRLASLAGGAVDTAELERIKLAQREADEAEERRIFYVACTRAEEHLVLSGATDLETRPEPRALCEPMRWAWRAFCPDLPAEGAAGVDDGRYEGRPLRVRWERCTPATLDELLPAADRRPVRPQPHGSAGGEQPPLEKGTPPAPRALPVSRLSYSGLAAYNRCGYRFYLERALRLPGGSALALGGPPDGVEASVEAEQETRAPDELSPLLRGSLVHLLLEELDLHDPVVPPAADVEALIERNGAAPRPAEVEDLRSMVAGFVASETCARLGRAARARAELPFAFTLEPPGARGRTLLVNGFVDVFAEEADGGVLIVDYKSDRLEGRDPRALVEESYATQRLVYALAALHGGAERVEVAYVSLERPGDPVATTYAATDAPGLERELLDRARGIVASDFRPTGTPHAELCADCPGQPALCTHEPERTLQPLAPSATARTSGT
jgi:ATP-dependent exoDNAse (exonuclease V) beta subunit